jgi:ubiquinone/menaquinone biosynthesis C-methylase UbiE
MTNEQQIELKNREHTNWSTAATAWKKYDGVTVRSFAPVSERMLAAASIGAGQRVLDIACGTGEPAIPAALQVGPNGFVFATDFSDAMLDVAREKAREKGVSNVEFRRVDGEEIELGTSFDAVLIRFGIMFMPDALSCLKHACRALKSGGRIAVATWTAVDRNPWLQLPLAAIKRHVEIPTPPPDAPGLFLYADPTRLRAKLEAADFVDVRLDEVPVTITGFATPLEYFRFITELSAPLSALLAKATPEARAKIDAEAVELLSPYVVGGNLSIGGVAWVASGQRTR